MPRKNDRNFNISESAQDQGFILVAVLWVTALLALFALYYSSSARVQGLQALNTAKLLKQTYALQSGLDWGVHEYRKYRENRRLLDNKEQIESIGEREINLKYPRQEPYTTVVGNQTVAVSIHDISGKMSVNSVDRNLFQDILAACGLQMGVKQTTVISSFLDWIDGDDLHRPEGAEKDYYADLDPAYVPKNGPLQSIEELLLIRGIDWDLYAGTTEHPGLRDFLTVYGQQTKMDITNAKVQTFSLIDDFPQDVIEDIVALRQEQPIDEFADIMALVPHEFSGQLKRYYTSNTSQYIQIVACIVTEGDELGPCAQKTLQRGES